MVKMRQLNFAESIFKIRSSEKTFYTDFEVYSKFGTLIIIIILSTLEIESSFFQFDVISVYYWKKIQTCFQTCWNVVKNVNKIRMH